METNKVKKSNWIMMISIVLLGFSCNTNESSYNLDSEKIMLEETGETPELASIESEDYETQSNDGIIDFKIKIIKNANCRMKVKSIEDATKVANQIARQYSGYVSDQRFSNTNYSKENRFTIRVPQDNFDTVLDQISELAEFIDYKNISTVDVTEEYIDIESRLKTKKEVKERYEVILRTKAIKVEDILKTEDKLRKLQEEIESAQGRLHYLKNKIAYSTIQLDIYEAITPKEKPSMYSLTYFDKAGKGLSFGWSLVENATVVLFYIWPFIILALVLIIYFKWIRK